MLIDTDIVIYIMAGIIFILITWIAILEIRLKKMFGGKTPDGLENILSLINKDIKELENSQKDVLEYLDDVEKRLKRSVQNVGIIRFNPFSDSGSNQSFSVAILDEKGNGAVITGLHSREKINVYAKPIKNYGSEYQLSPEEGEAIKKTKTDENRK